MDMNDFQLINLDIFPNIFRYNGPIAEELSSHSKDDIPDEYFPENAERTNHGHLNSGR